MCLNPTYIQCQLDTLFCLKTPADIHGYIHIHSLPSINRLQNTSMKKKASLTGWHVVTLFQKRSKTASSWRTRVWEEITENGLQSKIVTSFLRRKEKKNHLVLNQQSFPYLTEHLSHKKVKLVLWELFYRSFSLPLKNVIFFSFPLFLFLSFTCFLSFSLAVFLWFYFMKSDDLPAAVFRKSQQQVLFQDHCYLHDCQSCKKSEEHTRPYSWDGESSIWNS